MEGNGDTGVEDGGVVDESDVWKATAMRDLVDDVGVSGLH